MRHKNYGWTLIELIITLGIIGILCLGATWTLSSVAHIKQLSRVSADFLSALESSAQMAVSLGKDISITFRPGEQSVFIHTPVDKDSGALQLAKAYVLPKSVVLERATFGNIESNVSVLILRASGSATPGTIILRDDHGKRCQITQALRGQRSLKCFE